MTNGHVLVAAVQYAPTSLDPDTNVERMLAWIDTAASQKYELIVFPELSDSGYIRWPASRREIADVSRYAAIASTVPGATTEALSVAARRCGVHVVAGVLEVDSAIPGRLYNTAVLIDSHGRIIGTHRKLVASMAEMFYFSLGNSLEVFETDLGRIGIGICYDVLFPEHARIQTLKGMQIYCTVWNTAYPPALPQDGHVPVGYLAENVRQASQMRAAENGVFVVSSHRVGHDPFADADFMGLTCIVSPWGTLLASAEDDGEVLVGAKVNLDLINETRAVRPFLKDRRPGIYGPLSS